MFNNCCLTVYTSNLKIARKLCHPALFKIIVPQIQLVPIFKAIFLIPPYKINFENLHEACTRAGRGCSRCNPFSVTFFWELHTNG